MELEEIIEIANRYYTPGLYILNAYYKRHPKKKHEDPDFKEDALGQVGFLGEKINYVRNKSYQETEGNEGKIAIFDINDAQGCVYCDGCWADVCDKDGNIITLGEDHVNTLTLREARQIIYAE